MQEARLAQVFSRQYHLITRDDRLDKIADDLVRHFLGRGYRGKAMYIAIDKATAVRMYDKVQARWKAEIRRAEARLSTPSPERERAPSCEADRVDGSDRHGRGRIAGQNEIDGSGSQGLDIVPHRKRMDDEDLEAKFKDPDDPLRLVFVCAMWMTGFDVPSCSTIYLDKPMKNHTLMQTIARANRVSGDKDNGLIVDYVGVFRNLQRALAIYARGTASGEMPITGQGGAARRADAGSASRSGLCGRARGQAGGDPQRQGAGPLEGDCRRDRRASWQRCRQADLSSPRRERLEALQGGAARPARGTLRRRDGRAARSRRAHRGR